MLNIDDRLIGEIMPVLGGKAIAVLLAISKHMNKDREAWPSTKTIQKITGFGRDSVRKELAILEQHKLIERCQRRSEKGILSTTKFVVNTKLVNRFGGHQKQPSPENTFTVQPSPDYPSSDIPSPDYPTSDYPTTDNKTLSINKGKVLNSIGSIDKKEVLTKEGSCENKGFQKVEILENENLKKEKNSAKKEKRSYSGYNFFQEFKKVWGVRFPSQPPISADDLGLVKKLQFKIRDHIENQQRQRKNPYPSATPEMTLGFIEFVLNNLPEFYQDKLDVSMLLRKISSIVLEIESKANKPKKGISQSKRNAVKEILNRPRH